MIKQYSLKDRLWLVSCIFYIPAFSYLIAYTTGSTLVLCICTFFYYSFWYTYTLHHSQKVEILYRNIISMPATNAKKYLFLCLQLLKNNVFIYFVPQLLLYVAMFILFPKLHYVSLLCVLLTNVCSITFHVFAAEWSRRKAFGLYFYRNLQGIPAISFLLMILKVPFLFELSEISIWTIFVTLVFLVPVFFFVMRKFFLKMILSYPFENETLLLKLHEKRPIF